MDKNKIIALAHEAGIRDVRIEVSNGQLERFAALVEQATLEKAAQLCESYNWSSNGCAKAIRGLKP